MKSTLGFISPALLVVLTGCAAGPKPKALSDAERLLVGPEAASLEHERPGLIEEAEGLLRKAKQAQEAGDTDDAVVLAHASMAKYRTARDLVGAAQAEVLAARLSASMSPDEQRQLETDRFLEITERIDRLVQRIDDHKAESPPDPLRDEARAALLAAREKQSEAIGRDVPRKAPVTYAKATSHIGTALEALELGSLKMSLSESQKAVAGYEAAMKEAEAPVVVASGEDDASSAEAMGASLARAAEQAIVRARAAQARASAVPGANASPDFAGGSSLLDAAVSSYEGEVYDEARSLAHDAKRNFEAAARNKPAPTSGTATSIDVAPVGLEKRTEDLLVELQLRRAELIGQGYQETCRGAFGEFQAVVELARQRLDKNDVLRAWEFAIRAQERIKRCERSMGVPEAPEAPAPPVDDPAMRAAALTALQTARIELGAARRRDASSTLLTAGQGLLDSAQQAFTRGGHSEANVLAAQALQILRSVKVPAAVPTPPSAVATPAAANTPSSLGERRARSTVARAEEAQLDALERGASPEAMAMPDRLLTSANEKLVARQWSEAAQLAARARGQYGGLAREEAVPTPTGDAACGQARAEVTRLSSALMSDSKLEPGRRQSARSLYDAARRELEAKNCGSALSLAVEARQLALPGAPPVSPSSPTTALPPGLPSGGDGSPVDGEAPWQSAFEAIERASARRDQVRAEAKGSAASTFNLGLAALERARAAYEGKRWGDARREAELAERTFSGVSGPAPSVATGDNTPVVTGETEATTPRPATKRRVVVGGGEPWRKPYFVVYRALELRREARKAVADDTRDQLAAGEKAMAASRKLWATENYAGAAVQATNAQSHFAEVIAGGATGPTKPATAEPQPPKTPGGDAAQEPKATREEADAALREAKVVQRLCQRDECADRDFEALTRAEETIASAQSAFEAGQFGYAVSLAEEATEGLNQILAKPRKSKKPPEIDTEKKAEAEEAVANAEIQRKLCESRGCEKIDLEAWLLAQKDFAAAKSARADADFERATRLAAQADKAFRAIEKTAPSFVIPADASSVKRSGDQLYVSPAISFGSGSATLTRESMPAIEALAKVLKENAERLESVALIGFTDNSGNAALNKQLSARRAKAVRTALIRLGVPAALLSAEGRGPDSPIADNGTADGRKANRRVEIRFTLRKGTP